MCWRISTWCLAGALREVGALMLFICGVLLPDSVGVEGEYRESDRWKTSHELQLK